MYHVAIATVIFSHVKITCYFHMWRYHVFAQKLTWYFIGIYIIKIYFHSRSKWTIIGNWHYLFDHVHKVRQKKFGYLIFADQQQLLCHVNFFVCFHIDILVRSLLRFNIYPLKSRGISPDTYGLVGQNLGIFWKIELDNYIVSLSNALIAKHNFLAEQVEKIFILTFFSPTHEIKFPSWPYLGSATIWWIIMSKKTKDMWISFYKNSTEPDLLRINDSWLERVSKFKLLGVWQQDWPMLELPCWTDSKESQQDIVFF